MKREKRETFLPRILSLIACFGVSAGFLFLVFRKVELSRVQEIVLGVPIYVVLGLVATRLIAHGARVFRWIALTDSFGPLPFRSQTRITFVGAALVAFVPLRLGELARPILHSRESGTSLSSSIAAVAVERTIDGLFVTSLLFLSLWFLPERYEVPAALMVAGYGALALFGGALMAITASLVAKRWVYFVLNRTVGKVLPNVARRIESVLESFVGGLQALPDRRAVASVLFWTLWVWAMQVLGYYCLAMGLGWSLPWMFGPLLLAVVVFAIMVPAAPGFLGTYQGGVLFALTLFGLSETEAMAFGLVLYPVELLVVFACAMPYLFRDLEKIVAVVGRVRA